MVSAIWLDVDTSRPGSMESRRRANAVSGGASQRYKRAAMKATSHPPASASGARKG
ncbi:hypothetical protein D3C83_266190 [compost metagenome]